MSSRGSHKRGANGSRLAPTPRLFARLGTRGIVKRLERPDTSSRGCHQVNSSVGAVLSGSRYDEWHLRSSGTVPACQTSRPALKVRLPFLCATASPYAQT